MIERWPDPPESGPTIDAESRAFFQRLHRFTPKSWVTHAIIAVNLLVYVANVLSGLNFWSPTADQLLDWGAEYGPRTLAGEWWRMLTSAFLHGGLLHVAVNMWILRDGGRLVERLYGHTAFLGLYLIAALSGAVASLWWNPCAIGVGASGAVFGVFGALLAYVVVCRKSVPPALVKGFRSSATSFLVLNLVIGSMIEFIDNAAHVGGFVGGLVCGALLAQPIGPDGRHHGLVRDAIGLVVASVLLAVLGWQMLPPAPGDFIKVGEEVAAAEDEVITAMTTLEEEFQQGRVSPQEFVRRMRKDVLPVWEAATQQLEGLEGLTGEPARRFGILARFARKRQESFEARADALETGDLMLLRKSVQLREEAEALIAPLK